MANNEGTVQSMVNTSMEPSDCVNEVWGTCVHMVSVCFCLNHV